MADPPPFDARASMPAILYEYRMATATALHPGPASDAVTAFALLESFLVHARNLHEFLRPRPKDAKRRPGDYWACDFVAGFGIEVFDEPTVRMINRWLQHITTWRYSEEEHPSWDAIGMFESVHGAMGSFIEALDDDLAGLLVPAHVEARERLSRAGT